MVYRPPVPELLPSAVQGFQALTDSGSDDSPVQTAGLACLHVLKAHPFAEGNGRTARGVATYMLLRAGYVPRPFKSVETYVDSNVEEYYTKLGQSTLERPGPWLKYFARAANHAFRPPGESNPTGRLFVRAASRLKKVLG